MNNNKRIYLVLLIIGSLLALISVGAYFLWPFTGLKKTNTQPAPIDSQAQKQPFDPSRPPIFKPSAQPAPDINDPAEKERQAEEALKRDALSFVSRSGSYANSNDFSAMRQVYPQSTDTLREYLEAQRQALIEQYPSFGDAYGRTSRSLSAKLISSTPIIGGNDAVIEVQAQILTNNIDGTEVTSYEKVVLQYVKSGPSWLVERIDTSPLSL